MKPGLRRLLSISLVTVLGAAEALGVAAAGLTAPAPAAKSGPAAPIVEARAGGLTLTWEAPPVEVDYLRDGTASISAGGLPQMERPGATRLPFDAALIAIPPGAQPQLRTVTVEEASVPLLAPVVEVAYPDELVGNGRGRPVGATFAPTKRDGQTRPSQPLTLEDIGVLRGVRLARLRFFPALPQKDSLRVIHRVEAEISWGDSGSRGVAAPAPSDAMLAAVRGAVLNPDDAIPISMTSTVSARRTIESRPTALLEVGRRGVYSVSYGDLEAMGFSGVDPDNLRLFRGDEDVAYEWVGDDDQQFEANERIVFYAEPRFSRWTEVDVYRLIVDDVTGERMTTRSANPAGLQDGTVWVEQLVEENEVYMPDCFCGPLPAGRDGDRWAWKELFTPDESSAELPFDAPGVDGSSAAQIRLWFVGFTDLGGSPNHRVDVSLNGQALGQVAWDGRVAVAATLPIPVSVLEASDNGLSLSLPGIPGVDLEGCWLDAFSVRYARAGTASGGQLRFEGDVERRAYTVGLSDTSDLRAYDVTAPLAPRRLADVQSGDGTVELGDPPVGGPRRYALAARTALMAPDAIRAMRSPWTFNAAGAPAGADVLIITHPDFAAAVEPLVALRESQGLSVAVVNVLGIYDTWGDGRVDPEAIRAFIRHTYDHWDPAPTFVLLVGDGSFDPRQYRPDSTPTFLPPYLADVDPWAGEAAADNRYVCVDEGLGPDAEDALPDMMVGRLPVKTALEAEVAVNKAVSYEIDPPGGLWPGNVVLVADDPGPAGDFPALAEDELAPLVPPAYQVSKHYCEEGAPGADDCPAWRAGEMHRGLMEAWNEGALLFTYAGHASWQQWGGPLPFFHLNDLPSLAHGGRTPLAVALTCFTSAFQRPEPTLDESMIASSDGAVVTWGSTGLGLVGGHRSLGHGFFNAVFTDEVGTVGEAELGAKLYLASTGEDLELLDTFVVLGDPALAIHRRAPTRLFLPVVLRGG